jgi:hypothetical protein
MHRHLAVLSTGRQQIEGRTGCFPPLFDPAFSLLVEFCYVPFNIFHRTRTECYMSKKYEEQGRDKISFLAQLDHSLRAVELLLLFCSVDVSHSCKTLVHILRSVL